MIHKEPTAELKLNNIIRHAFPPPPVRVKYFNNVLDLIRYARQS